MSNDKTGYCNPPKKHRFKKGKSGNLKGRPKNKVQKSAHPSEASILGKIYDETVIVGGNEMTNRELELRVLLKKALSGNVPAMKLLEEKQVKAGIAGGKPPRQGVLRLPTKVSEEEWKERAEKNQAQYRENRRDDREVK